MTQHAEDGGPFFLRVSYTHPHDPYLCLQEHWDNYEGVDIPPPKTGMIPHNENDPHSLRVLKQHGFDDVMCPMKPLPGLGGPVVAR